MWSLQPHYSPFLMVSDFATADLVLLKNLYESSLDYGVTKMAVAEDAFGNLKEKAEQLEAEIAALYVEVENMENMNRLLR